MTEQDSDNINDTAAAGDGPASDLAAAAVQDTGYVFDAHEANLVASVIDDGFANTVGYVDAHDKIRLAVAAMRGAGGDDVSKPADLAEAGDESICQQ